MKNDIRMNRLVILFSYLISECIDREFSIDDIKNLYKSNDHLLSTKQKEVDKNLDKLIRNDDLQDMVRFKIIEKIETNTYKLNERFIFLREKIDARFKDKKLEDLTEEYYAEQIIPDCIDVYDRKLNKKNKNRAYKNNIIDFDGIAMIKFAAETEHNEVKISAEDELLHKLDDWLLKKNLKENKMTELEFLKQQRDELDKRIKELESQQSDSTEKAKTDTEKILDKMDIKPVDLNRVITEFDLL